MSVCKALFLLWMFSLLSRTGSGYDYKDYSDLSYNDITEEQQPVCSVNTSKVCDSLKSRSRDLGELIRASPCPCDSGEQLRWEKIFIMMEDSHVMQKILLQANEELKMEISSLRNHIQKISSDISTSCLRVVEETCRSMHVQQNLRVEQNMTRRQRDVEQGVSVQEVEELEKVDDVDEIEEEAEVKAMMELGKTEKIEERDKWWTKWKFWR